MKLGPTARAMPGFSPLPPWHEPMICAMRAGPIWIGRYPLHPSKTDFVFYVGPVGGGQTFQPKNYRDERACVKWLRRTFDPRAKITLDYAKGIERVFDVKTITEAHLVELAAYVHAMQPVPAPHSAEWYAQCAEREARFK